MGQCYLVKKVEHYSNILNQPSPSTVYDFANIAQPEEPDVSMEPITITEVQDTIQLLKNGKPPRLDQISAEFLKYGRDHLVQELTVGDRNASLKIGAGSNH